MPRYDKPSDYDSIREFAKAKKESAQLKYQEILDSLLSQGYSKESANRKADSWLDSINKSWDDFVTDQTRILSARLGELV